MPSQDIRYPALPPHPLMTGEELVAGTGTVLGYWRWAHSDLSANTERGLFAEYLVRLALGLDGEPPTPWSSYDVLWRPEGRGPVRIEVKASSYVQVWAQRALSRPTFSIAEAEGWDEATGQYDGRPRRHSDVYVLCLETYRGTGRPDPTDAVQWEFYVVPTATLDARGHQKSISLTQVRGALGVAPTRWEGLPAAIIGCLAEPDTQ